MKEYELICDICLCVSTEENPVTIVNGEQICEECMEEAAL
jgi:hypothetical protein